LHLIEPLGFRLDDAQLKRAGLDYWQHLRWHRWLNWTAFQKQLSADARLWLIESKGPRHYAEARYQPGDYLVFGRETAGLPAEIIAQYPEAWLRIPMFDTHVRSLNLSNCVALVLYEALRQQGFAGEI
jgi:tRNA (cytidine/uridine-2'-O-)-methyltransferase